MYQFTRDNYYRLMFMSLYLLYCSGLPAGIYATNNPEACQFVAHDCKANILVVENQKQLDKILQVGLISQLCTNTGLCF